MWMLSVLPWASAILAIICGIALLKVIIHNRKDLWDAADLLSSWGKVGPLLLTFAAFLLTFQQAMLLQQELQQSRLANRPLLLISRIEDGDVSKLGFVIVNAGNAPGKLMGVRMVAGNSSKKDTRTNQFESNYVFSPEDIQGNKSNYIFPKGELPLRENYILPKKILSSFLKSYPIQVIVEMDYMEINTLNPRKYISHFRMIIRNSEGVKASLEPLSQTDVEGEEWRSGINLLDAMVVKGR